MTTASATAVLLVLSLLSIANAITKNGPEPCLSLSPTELEKFQNGPTEGLDFPCPSGYALYSVDACFDRFDLDTRRKRSAGEDYDRLWKWKCRPVSSLRKETCRWFNDINELDGSGDPVPVIFQCPKNYFMAGVRSVFVSGSFFDRIWSVRCCQLENWCQRDCYLTDFVNDIGISFEHRTSDEDKVVFTGFFSEFDQSSSNDRRWKFEQCKLSLCDFEALINYKTV